MKQLINNIKRIYRWLPVIWSDRDWDSSFLTKIILFKLQQMWEYYSNSDNVWMSEDNRLKIINSLHTTITLIKSIDEDDYCPELFEEFNKDFDNRINNSTKTEVNEEIWWKMPNSSLEIKASFDKARKKAQELKNKDIEELIKVLKDNYTTWWD